MDEFRKPYEYEEERISGFLLIFVILLVSIDIFLALSLVVQCYEITSRVSAAGIVFLGFTILYLLFVPFTAMTCYKVKKNMIPVAKVFLGTRAVFFLFCHALICINSINDKSLIGNGAGQFQNISDLIMIVLVLPAAYTLVFSIGWFLYFTKSKKCAELVNSRRSSKKLSLQ